MILKFYEFYILIDYRYLIIYVSRIMLCVPIFVLTLDMFSQEMSYVFTDDEQKYI